MNVGGAIELDIGRARDEAFNVEGGKCDEVVFVELVNVKDGVADLLVEISDCRGREELRLLLR